MRLLLVALFVCLMSCSGQGADQKAASKIITSGDVSANNLIIYNNGRQMTFGDQRLSGSGAFVPMGPTAIYVLRAVSDAELASLAEQGVHLIPHTAYLLPEGEGVSLEALKKMKPVGHIDPALSQREVMDLLGFGI